MLAVAIACLGIHGLASFSMIRRTKEIGIRKTLGASAGSILGLPTVEFGVLVVIASIVAWPVGYFATQRWLAGFVSSQAARIRRQCLIGGRQCREPCGARQASQALHHQQTHGAQQRGRAAGLFIESSSNWLAQRTGVRPAGTDVRIDMTVVDYGY